MSSSLTVRMPKFNFDGQPIIWDDEPEISVLFNGGSTFLPVFEPWLNRVLIRCGKLIGSFNQEFRKEINDFVRQESNHYRMHESYNSYVERLGYCLPHGMQEEAEDDYRDKLNNKSIAWLAAYAAGFENLSLYQALYLYEKADFLRREGDIISEIMMWHLAEEYEHRAVCHEAFRLVSGNYFIRIWGVFYSFFHLNGHLRRRGDIYLAEYRKGMTREELRESKRREKTYKRGMFLWMLPRMLRVFVPFYNPAKIPAPGSLHQALDRYEAMTNGS